MRKLNEPGDKKAMQSAASQEMHCAGCGSKLGPDIIAGNLNNLDVFNNDAVTPALGKSEDASLWQVSRGNLAVQSIDGFRSFSEDYWRFGKICVNHALSDLYAMAATPVSAQVWINLAHAHPRIHKRDHGVLMAAIVEALNQQQVALAGGHSSEGMETHIAIVANGEVEPGKAISKNTANAGDVLVITKPLGTGVILVADMQAKAPAQATDTAFDSMLQSNRDIALVLQEYNVSAVTDVTGFGLLGHLLEMLSSTNLYAELNLKDVPLLSGAYQLSAEGFRSSLYPQLQPYLLQCDSTEGLDSDYIDLLLDPQTSGGLLIALPETQAKRLTDTFESAVVIGQIKAGQHSADQNQSAATADKRIRIC